MKLLSPVDKVDEVDKLIQAGDFQYQARSWEYPLLTTRYHVYIIGDKNYEGVLYLIAN
jgi:hypothetical protein